MNEYHSYVSYQDIDYRIRNVINREIPIFDFYKPSYSTDNQLSLVGIIINIQES